MNPCNSCGGTGSAPGIEGGLCEDCETPAGMNLTAEKRAGVCESVHPYIGGQKNANKGDQNHV